MLTKIMDKEPALTQREVTQEIYKPGDLYVIRLSASRFYELAF